MPNNSSLNQEAISAPNRIKRLGVLLAWLGSAIVLLLLPPAWVPYAVLTALTGMTWAKWNDKSFGPPTVLLVVLLLVKQIYMPWSAWFVAGFFGVLGVLGLLARTRRLGKGWAAVPFTGCWISSLILMYQFEFESRQAVFDPNLNRRQRSVVCVGDSLTAYGYPKVLSTMINMPVVDLSEDGITTVQGVRKLDDILAAQPKVVVIELGGHDYLKGWPREEIKERLAQMISECQSNGAAVILFEIPCGLVTDPTRGVFREVAREHGARLIPDTAIRKLVFCSPHFPPCRWGWLPQLSDDGIHPNTRGNQALAVAVRDAIGSLNLLDHQGDQQRPTDH